MMVACVKLESMPRTRVVPGPIASEASVLPAGIPKSTMNMRPRDSISDGLRQMHGLSISQDSVQVVFDDASHPHWPLSVLHQ